MALDFLPSTVLHVLHCTRRKLTPITSIFHMSFGHEQQKINSNHMLHEMCKYGPTSIKTCIDKNPGQCKARL